MPITIKNTAGGGVTLDSTTSSNETLQLPSGGGTLAPLASPSFTGTTSANKLNVTGVVDNTISGTLVVKGSLSANQTSGLALFQQSSTASTIKAFGPNATTTGILNTYVAASDGSPDLLITSVTADGLTFNGDTAAANALDDYEEGTWTPVTSLGTATANAGTYTKIGRQVYVGGDITFPAQSNSGAAIISGLPFSSANADGAATAGYTNFLAEQLLLTANAGATISLYGLTTSAVGGLSWTQMSGKRVVFSYVYHV